MHRDGLFSVHTALLYPSDMGHSPLPSLPRPQSDTSRGRTKGLLSNIFMFSTVLGIFHFSSPQWPCQEGNIWIPATSLLMGSSARGRGTRVAQSRTCPLWELLLACLRRSYMLSWIPLTQSGIGRQWGASYPYLWVFKSWLPCCQYCQQFLLFVLQNECDVHQSPSHLWAQFRFCQESSMTFLMSPNSLQALNTVPSIEANSS